MNKFEKGKTYYSGVLIPDDGLFLERDKTNNTREIRITHVTDQYVHGMFMCQSFQAKIKTVKEDTDDGEIYSQIVEPKQSKRGKKFPSFTFYAALNKEEILAKRANFEVGKYYYAADYRRSQVTAVTSEMIKIESLSGDPVHNYVPEHLESFLQDCKNRPIISVYSYGRLTVGITNLPIIETSDDCHSACICHQNMCYYASLPVPKGLEGKPYEQPRWDIGKLSEDCSQSMC